jgi:hypothetical protein
LPGNIDNHLLFFSQEIVHDYLLSLQHSNI